MTMVRYVLKKGKAVVLMMHDDKAVDDKNVGIQYCNIRKSGVDTMGQIVHYYYSCKWRTRWCLALKT